MSINNCVKCGIQFEAKRSDKLYCSSSCMIKYKNGKGFCVNCNKEFDKTGPNVKFCSATCSERYKWEHKKPEFDYIFIRSSKESQARFVIVKCGVCGQQKEIRVGDYNRSIKQFGQIFCSRQCAMIATGKSIKLKCSECNKDFIRKMSDYNNYNKNSKYVFCSRKCQDANIDYILRGASHYCFIDGQSNNIRGKGWKRIRKIIRSRDNYTCQICGVTEKKLGKRLDVHHIKPYRDFDDPEEANKKDNLVALCPSCHHKEENKILKQNGKS